MSTLDRAVSDGTPLASRVYKVGCAQDVVDILDSVTYSNYALSLQDLIDLGVVAAIKKEAVC